MSFYTEEEVAKLRETYPIGTKVAMFKHTEVTFSHENVTYYGEVVAVNMYGVQIEWTGSDLDREFITSARPGFDKFMVVTDNGDLMSLSDTISGKIAA